MKYTVDKKQNIYKGRIFSIEKSRLKLNGYKFYRETVVHPGAVAILPILNNKKVILVRQFRYAAKKELWEIPAGTLDKNETPLQCAKRELEEETGYKAKSFKKLFSFYPCPGYSAEKIYLYKANHLKKTMAKPDEDEFIKIKSFTRLEIIKLINKKKIEDAKTLIGLSIWLKK